MRNAIERIKNGLAKANLNISKIMASTMAVALLSSGLLTSAEASSDALDASFGLGGKVVTDFFGKADSAVRMVIQPDGRIVVAGEADSDSGVGSITLARYNPNGSLDTSFGAGGKVATAVGFSSFGSAVALEPDGRIVVGGSSFLTSKNESLDFAAARYDSDGNLDTSFGSGGIVTTDFFGDQDFVSDIAIRPDGRIIVSGTVRNPHLPQLFALAQYYPNGGLDASFGSGGKVLTDFADLGGENCVSRALLLQSDGRVIVVGETHITNTFDDDFALARYNNDGSLDATFGTGGKLRTDFFGNEDHASGIVGQPDGRYVVAGSANFTPDFASVDFALARYNSDGSLDTSFGVGGKAITDFRGGADYAAAVVLLATGRILVGGQSLIGKDNATSDFALARYDANGVLDNTFGVDGKVLNDFFGNRDVISEIAVQPDGRYVAVGQARLTSDYNSTDFALARYVGDLTFDICVQDDVTRTLLKFNSQTGDYFFQNCKQGITLSGRGVVSQSGCKLDLYDSGPDKQFDRSVTAHVNTCTRRGNVSVQIPSSTTATMISDSNIDNNTGVCH